MKRKGIKKLGLCLAAVLVCTQISFVSLAYFDRGDVKVRIGKSSVSLEAGESENVTVSISPSSDRQLPGCGMPECPQSCGEGCLNADGECTCGGTTYQTYYARGEVSSSNTGVATASYSNGVLSIRGVSQGTATITVTASLRQYNSTSDSIEVTVAKKSSGQSSAGSSSESTGDSSSSPEGSQNSKGSSSSSSGKGNSSLSSGTGSASQRKDSSSSGTGSGSSGSSSKVSVTSVDNAGGSSDTRDSGGQPEDGEDASQNNERKVISSDRGKITFIPIKSGKMGKADFESIKGKKEYIDFQMKDKTGTVLYAWEFLGTDIQKPEDMDLTIETGSEAFEGLKTSGKDRLYISFGHDGTLPGKASVFLRVADTFSDEETLNLYYYNEKDQSTALVTGGLKPESGYVTFELTHCSRYILTTEDLEGAVSSENQLSAEPETSDQVTEEKQTGFKPWMGAVIAAAAVAAAGITGWTLKRKKDKED